jgi:hypothetical protein
MFGFPVPGGAFHPAGKTTYPAAGEKYRDFFRGNPAKTTGVKNAALSNVQL